MGDDQSYTLADLKDSYSPKELADLTHLSPRSVLRKIEEGEIFAVHVSPRIYRIPKRAAEAWLAERSTFPVPA